MKEGTLGSRPVLMSTLEKAKKGNGRVHYLGLVSDGGVHSHIEHLKALLTETQKAKVPNCFVHFFSDGRDTSPVSGGEC